MTSLYRIARRDHARVGVTLGMGILLAAALATVWMSRGSAATAMTPVERLVAEDAIRQQIALYGLLADGDGVRGKDLRALADRTLSPDVVSEVVDAVGATVSHTTGRDEIVDSTPPTPSTAPSVGRHFLVATYFDELTPTTARTRTTSLYLNVTRNSVGAGCERLGPDACGGRVVRAVLFVYHDTWALTPQGWQKTRSVLRRDS